MINTIVNSFDIWTDAQGIKSRTRVKSVDNISLEGISSLRALIIELALRGKLIPQDSSNEPANHLIKKIALEKDKLIAAGKIPKQKSLKEIEQTKMPYSLLDGWEWAWFSDLYFFQEGPGIRNWQFRNSGIKLLNVQNIVGDKLILDNTDKYIDIEEYQQKYQHFTIEENDLVFASSGGSWGKSAFFNNPGYKVIVNTSTIRMHPFLEDCPRNYLKLFLDSKLFKDQMTAQLVGIQPNFGSTHLFKILIPIPPSKEQYLIASKVDELMALCDKLEAEQFNNLKTHQVLVKTLLETLTQAADANELQVAWERMSQHFDTLFCTEDSIDQLKQTILQLAVMGKLVQQDPNEEPASELLKKIGNEKERLVKEKKIKDIVLTEVTNEQEPFRIPQNWKWIRLGNITNKLGSGSTPRGGNNAYSDSGILFLRSQNIRNEGLLLDDVAFIDEATNKKMSNTIVFPNDILLNITGGSLGRCTIFPEEANIANVSQHVTIIRPTNMKSTAYLHSCILSPYIQNLIWGRQIGANREGLSKKVLEQFEIPYPPISEQKRIMSKIKELFALCDSLIEKTKKSQEIKIFLSKTIIEKVVE